MNNIVEDFKDKFEILGNDFMDLFIKLLKEKNDMIELLKNL